MASSRSTGKADVTERLTRLEDDMATMARSVGEVISSIKETNNNMQQYAEKTNQAIQSLTVAITETKANISETRNASGKISWQNVVSTLGAVFAAVITSSQLFIAPLSTKIEAYQQSDSIRHVEIEKELTTFRNTGSPVLRAEFAAQIKSLSDDVADLKKNDCGARFSVLESDMKRLNEHDEKVRDMFIDKALIDKRKN